MSNLNLMAIKQFSHTHSHIHMLTYSLEPGHKTIAMEKLWIYGFALWYDVHLVFNNPRPSPPSWKISQ